MITIPGVAPNMIANNLEPFYPTHPGEILKDEIEYRGISQKELAAATGVPYTLLNEVLNAKRPMSAEIALLVEAALDLPAEPFIKMQAKYNMLVSKRNGSFMQRVRSVKRVAAAAVL